MAEPDAKTIVDEAFKEGKDGKGEGFYVGLFVDDYEEVCSFNADSVDSKDFSSDEATKGARQAFAGV